MSNRVAQHWPRIIELFQSHLAAMKQANAEKPGSAGISKPGSRGRRIIFEHDVHDRRGTLSFMYHATKGWRVKAS